MQLAFGRDKSPAAALKSRPLERVVEGKASHQRSLFYAASLPKDRIRSDWIGNGGGKDNGHQGASDLQVMAIGRWHPPPQK